MKEMFLSELLFFFIEEFLFFPRRRPSHTLRRAGSESFKATIFQQKIILYMYILSRIECLCIYYLRIASI